MKEFSNFLHSFSFASTMQSNQYNEERKKNERLKSLFDFHIVLNNFYWHYVYMSFWCYIFLPILVCFQSLEPLLCEYVLQMLLNFSIHKARAILLFSYSVLFILTSVDSFRAFCNRSYLSCCSWWHWLCSRRRRSLESTSSAFVSRSSWSVFSY